MTTTYEMMCDEALLDSIMAHSSDEHTARCYAQLYWNTHRKELREATLTEADVLLCYRDYFTFRAQENKEHLTFLTPLRRSIALHKTYDRFDEWIAYALQHHLLRKWKVQCQQMNTLLDSAILHLQEALKARKFETSITRFTECMELAGQGEGYAAGIQFLTEVTPGHLALPPNGEGAYQRITRLQDALRQRLQGEGKQQASTSCDPHAKHCLGKQRVLAALLADITASFALL